MAEVIDDAPTIRADRIAGLLKHETTLEDGPHFKSMIRATNQAITYSLSYLSMTGDYMAYRYYWDSVTQYVDVAGVVMGKEIVPARVENRFVPLNVKVVFPFAPRDVMLTEDDKRERVFVFLELFVEHGVIMPCAKAVGVPYPRLLAWINDSPELRAAKDIAESMRIQRLEDTAMQLALEGDGGMLRFMLGQLSPKFRQGTKAAQTERGVDAKEAENKLTGIIKRAEDGILERMTRSSAIEETVIAGITIAALDVQSEG